MYRNIRLQLSKEEEYIIKILNKLGQELLNTEYGNKGSF